MDGKLDSRYKRPAPYRALSLEQDGIQAGDHTLPFQDLLPDPCQVEEYVVAKLTVLDIISFLEPEEKRCVLFLCQGFSIREAAARLQEPYQRVKKRLAVIREKLRLLISESVQ